jgi:DNA-binding response OmpR family regulator
MEDSAAPVTSTTQKTILLADDEQFILLAYKDGLQTAGYNVILAEDGEQALEQMRTTHPDLVLLDIIMPKLNGFEVLQAAKVDPAISAIPVAVLTNLSQLNDEQEARTAGAVDFIVKADVSLNDLLARIERLFV